MRVLILSQLYPNVLQPHLGIFAHRQAQALKRQGCEIRVVSPVPWVPFKFLLRGRWPNYNLVPKWDQVDGIEVVYPRYLAPPRWWRVSYQKREWPFLLGRVLARIKKHFAFDLIQSYGLFPDGYAAMKLGRIFGVPSLCTAVGRDITYWPYHLRGAMAASRETIQNLDQIIAVCDAQRQAIERFASPPHPVRVIFWGINPDLFARDEALRLERRAAVSAGPSDVILFYAGSLVRTKGVFELIAAFDNLCVKHSNLILILAGAGPDREDLERKATDLIASGALRLLGQVDPVHIPAWLHTADVFVFPSHSEGLSNAVCEAMAAGKAIVASAVGGHPEIIQDSQTGLLVPAKDTQALEEALERVISSEVLRQRLGMAARQHAVSILSMEKISEELHAVYHDVLSRGGRPGHCHEQSQA